MLVSSLPARMVELVSVVNLVHIGVNVLRYGMGSSALSVSKICQLLILRDLKLTQIFKYDPWHEISNNLTF